MDDEKLWLMSFILFQYYLNLFFLYILRIYIYIYIITIIFKTMKFPDSYATRSYHPSLLASSLELEVSMNVSPCGLVNTGPFVYQSPWENVAYVFVFTSAAPSMSCLIGRFVRCEVSNCTAAVLWGAISKFCSKHHVAYSCSFHLAFSRCISSESG